MRPWLGRELLPHAKIFPICRGGQLPGGKLPEVQSPEVQSPDWQRLREEIEQEVALCQTQRVMGGKRFPWWQVADPDAVLQSVVECIELAGDNTHGQAGPVSEDPFWAASWRSAIGLERFLQQLSLSGQCILELGCGCGAVGTTAAIQGGLVTMTDASELALKIARLNSWKWRERIETRQLVWGQGCVGDQKYSIILGSDIAYEPRGHAALESTARLHLAPGGIFYVAEPGRRSGERFAGHMRDQGWRVKHHQIDIADGRPAIRIFECRMARTH